LLASPSPGHVWTTRLVHHVRCTAPLPCHLATDILFGYRVVFSLIIINKAGGLVYQREFQAGLRKLSTNDYLVLAGTFHGIHAITRSITPKLPLSQTTNTASSPSTTTPAASGYAYPNPGVPASGLEHLETDRFRLTCFQTLTGTKFLLFTDPMSGNVETIMQKVYELYADYVMKNPFYQLEMPVRCEAFDRHLAAWLRGRT
ncbi:Sybindin-like protein, partial [Penicillium alfredii]